MTEFRRVLFRSQRRDDLLQVPRDRVQRVDGSRGRGGELVVGGLECARGRVGDESRGDEVVDLLAGRGQRLVDRVAGGAQLTRLVAVLRAAGCFGNVGQADMV